MYTVQSSKPDPEVPNSPRTFHLQADMKQSSEMTVQERREECEENLEHYKSLLREARASLSRLSPKGMTTATIARYRVQWEDIPYMALMDLDGSIARLIESHRNPYAVTPYGCDAATKWSIIFMGAEKAFDTHMKNVEAMLDAATRAAPVRTEADVLVDDKAEHEAVEAVSVTVEENIYAAAATVGGDAPPVPISEEDVAVATESAPLSAEDVPLGVVTQEVPVSVKGQLRPSLWRPWESGESHATATAMDGTAPGENACADLNPDVDNKVSYIVHTKDSALHSAVEVEPEAIKAAAPPSYGRKPHLLKLLYTI